MSRQKLNIPFPNVIWVHNFETGRPRSEVSLKLLPKASRLRKIRWSDVLLLNYWRLMRPVSGADNFLNYCIDGIPPCKWCLHLNAFKYFGEKHSASRITNRTIKLWFAYPVISPLIEVPDSKVHGASMGATWVLSAPDGPHVGFMGFLHQTTYCKSAYIEIHCCRVLGVSSLSFLPFVPGFLLCSWYRYVVRYIKTYMMIQMRCNMTRKKGDDVAKWFSEWVQIYLRDAGLNGL